MCDWEEFIFSCRCSVTKLKSHCHFARNDPNHQCFGVQVLKKVWDLPEVCDKCLAESNWRAGAGSRVQQHHLGWPRSQQTYGYGHTAVSQGESGHHQSQGEGSGRRRR
ncbi:hypothetical protein NKR23_g1447 [Pleurostoma richardsiae]|uniref:Uncharacterized protein n=1 Tax=Pleurostoma richardsiae TaxID=41990 RepID=A0AA38S044_9PEZI|nr:hypothetical protein NKR23_g1447 [Pleurostoma richardsiae]